MTGASVILKDIPTLPVFFPLQRDEPATFIGPGQEIRKFAYIVFCNIY